MANALQRSNNALMRSQVTPEQMNAGAMRRRMNAFEEEQARKAAEIQQFGRPLNNFERMTTTLPVSDSPADIQSNLANVMGSTWGGGMAANVLENPIRAAGGLLNPRRSAGYVPLTTFHGSPHRINNVDEANPMGRFDMDKIGTGEGAQAYGHGIYLAETPGVAKGYRVGEPASGTASPRRTFKGVELEPGSPEYHAATLVETSRQRIPSIRKEVRGWIDEWAEKGRPMDAREVQGWKKTLEVLDSAGSKKDFGKLDPGHLYTVDLPDEHIEKMLDWDAPLSEQPAAVRAALEKVASEFGTERMPFIAPSDTGESIYTRLAQEMVDFDQYAEGGDQMASEYLKKLGIPGIRYFDGGSRAAGAGTRNFVIFDPDIAKILNRE